MTNTEPVDPRVFRTVLGRFCTGITIITTVDEDEPIGFACQSFAALSLDPPMVLFCPTKQSRSWVAIESSGKFAVNILGEDQQATCARFGSREPDKFGGIDWYLSDLGSPILDGSLAHIDCTVETVHDGGDHFVVFGRVQSMWEVPAGRTNTGAWVGEEKQRPLLFYRGQYTAIEPDKTEPAAWRNDLESFLTTSSLDTWL